MNNIRSRISSLVVSPVITTKTRAPWSLYVTDFKYIESHQYPGKGTREEPFLVNWLTENDDQEDPQSWPTAYKWTVSVFITIAVFAVFFCSSAYTGNAHGLITQFHVSDEVFTLGISLFVLGFAIGPLLWAPLSEVLGRRIVFIITYGAMTAFNAGCAGAQNIETVLIMRFFAAAFGSSVLSNAGGAIADVFTASQRSLAMVIFSGATFLGPVLGPIAGGFVGSSTGGWRWVNGMMAILTGVIFIVGVLFYPETYAPTLLQKRAKKLSLTTGNAIYRSKFEGHIEIQFLKLLKASLSRPWVLLFCEPIVFFLSFYMAIVYGILYMLFAAFPIVYGKDRGWSAGFVGLAFCGLAVGMIVAIIYILLEKNRYNAIAATLPGSHAPPEARLPPAIVGAFAIPIGLFWFAWTNYPSIHFMASITAGVPLAFGIVLIFTSIFNYLIDSYTIYVASVLAANLVLRSIFGAVFPLFTPYMYNSLGIHWASSLPGFLALACLPFPFIFWKYGARIRQMSKFTMKAQVFLDQMVTEPQEKGEADNIVLVLQPVGSEMVA